MITGLTSAHQSNLIPAVRGLNIPAMIQNREPDQDQQRHNRQPGENCGYDFGASTGPALWAPWSLVFHQ